MRNGVQPQRKIKIKRRGKKKPNIFWPVFAILIIFLAVFSYQVYELVQLKRTEYQLQQDFEEQKAMNEKLEEEKKQLQTPEAIEKVAREELGLVKPGEVPYVR